MRTALSASLMLLSLSACAGRGPLNISCPEFAQFKHKVPYSELEQVIHSGRAPVAAPPSDLTQKLDKVARAHAPKTAAERQLGAARPTTGVLMLSGGGQWGAFGAGYLDQSRLNQTLPEFSFVSGVSTGALQALFVSIGSPEAYAMLLEAYAPKKESDIVDRGSALSVVFEGSMAGLAPLQAKIQTALCADAIIDDPAKACALDALKAMMTPSGQTKVVLIGFVEAASGEFQYVDVVELAQLPRRAARQCITGAALASAAMPVSFQQVRINNVAYYDGGTRASVFEANVAAAAEALSHRPAPDAPLNRQPVPDALVPIYVVRNGPTTVPEDDKVNTDDGALTAAQRAEAILVNQLEITSIAVIRIEHPKGPLWMNSADGYVQAGCVKPTDGTMFSPVFMQCLTRLGRAKANANPAWIALPELPLKKPG